MKNGTKRAIRFNVILSFCLIAIGLLINPWLLGYLFQITSVSLQAKIFIGIFEAFFIIFGLFFYFKGGSPKGRKQLLFTLVGVVIIIIIVEIGLQIINAVTQSINPEQDTVDYRISLSPYQDKEWARTYWKEHYAIQGHYVQYLSADTKEYHGEYVNINSEGVRKTWQPEHPRATEQITLYVFGGSTLWGTGARDDYTIPSYLSRLFYDNGYNVIVHNYGEGSYTFTQEVVHLILLLREGHRPTYVIFYDGANDVYAAYQSGIPGTLQNVSIIREKLGLTTSLPNLLRLLLKNTWSIFAQHCMTYRALGNMLNLISPQQQFTEAASSYSDEELQSLAHGTAEYYLNSVELLDHLSQAYGFKYACFWQPVVFTEKKLTDEETKTDLRINDRALGTLYRMTKDSLTARSPTYFFDISDVLSDRTTTYYIDWAHISEEGNEVVATEIFQTFQKEFVQESSALKE